MQARGEPVRSAALGYCGRARAWRVGSSALRVRVAARLRGSLRRARPGGDVGRHGRRILAPATVAAGLPLR
jgi:hypothetical protein